MTQTLFREKIAESNSLLEKAKAILENPESTMEEKNQVEPLMTDAKALRAEADQLRRIAEQLADPATQAQLKQYDDREDDEKDAKKSAVPFGSWANYLSAVWYAGHKDRAISYRDPRLRWFREKHDVGEDQVGDRKNMTGATGAAGGFLIPDEFDPTLRGALGEGSIVRSRATVITMNRRVIKLPLLDQSDATAGVPSWFGGMSFTWVGEGVQKTSTDPVFDQLSLSVNKLVGYTVSSDELVDDSAISLADFLASPLGFVGGVRFMEDYYFLMGNGTGQPIGILNAANTALKSITRAASGSVAYSDLVDIYAAFLPSATNPVWIAHTTLLPQLLELSGPTGNPSYIWGSAVNGVPNTLLGRPIVFSEKVPALNSLGDIGLYDFGYYAIGDRGATTIETTQYDRWAYDETSWRIVHRVDGKPWMKSVITLMDGATEVSPFVALAAGV